MTYEFDSDIKMLEGMKKPYVISISSVSGGGKTTIVNLLKDKLPNTAVISFDDYNDSEVYLDRDINDWSREGNDENEWHTQPIADDIEKLISAQYDTIILDYPFGHRNACVSKYIDLAVFIDTPLDVALARRIIRDYTNRNENNDAGLADAWDVSLQALDKYLHSYLAHQRPTYTTMAKTQIPSSDLVVDGTKSPEDIVAEIVHVIKKGTNAAYTADKHVQPAIEPSLGYIMESKTASHNQSAIMNLRRFIGHMPLLTISAGVILENSKGEVLLERRLDNGMWADIGGALEPGESLEDCAKRELFEESGLTAHSLELFEIFSGQPPHTYPNGDVCENTGVLYICRDFSGELKAQEDEVLEFRWFSLDEIINNMDQISKPSRIIFEKYIEKRRKEAG